MNPLDAQHKRFSIFWEHHLESFGFTWKFYKTGGVRLNTSALFSWEFWCLSVPALSSLEEHTGPLGAGDHGKTLRHEGCLRRWERQQDEGQGLKAWPEKESRRKKGQGMAWRSEMKEGRTPTEAAGGSTWYPECPVPWLSLSEEHDDCVGGPLKLCKKAFLSHVVLELKFLVFNIWISG